MTDTNESYWDRMRREHNLDRHSSGGSARMAAVPVPARPMADEDTYEGQEDQYPYHECSAERGASFKVLQALTYLLVIVTCLAILFQMVRFELALNEFQQQMENLRNSFSGGLLEGW